MSHTMPDFVRADLIRRFKHAAMVAHFGDEDEDDAMQLAGIRAAKQTIQEFDAFGPEGRLALTPLLHDPDASIRVLAAGYLLRLMPERAVAVLKDIRANCSNEAHWTAFRILDKHERGELEM